MAKVCYFTGRKTVSGNNRSRDEPNKRAVKPNLQKLLFLSMENLKKFGLQLVPWNQVKLNALTKGKSQIGTASTSIGQAVHDITKSPVQTSTGDSIVSTQNGHLILSDGSVVAPEALELLQMKTR